MSYLITPLGKYLISTTGQRIVFGDVSTGTPSTLLTGLMALWELDEASGTVYDSTANNIDLAGTSVTYQQAGKLNYSVAMNATGDMLKSGTGSTLDLTTFTVSTWAKTSDNTKYNTIVSKTGYDTNIRGWRLQTADTGNVVFETWDSGAGTTLIFSDTTINNGNWHHLLITFTTTSIRLYIDGTEDTGSPYAHTTTPFYTAASTLYIGNDVYEDTNAFYGNIDQTAIWNRVLTSGEIAEIYNSSNGKVYPF